MRPRQNILEIFSTFIQFEGDRFSAWATDPSLRRSMQQCLANSPQHQSSQKFWALYWHKQWQNNATIRAREHLTAYLQEVCFWAAQKTAAGFGSSQYSLSDYFQMAIARIEKILNNFDPQQGVALRNYAKAIFNTTMREILRQRQEVDICTAWGLLRKISQKRLMESLQQVGLSEKTIARYILAWHGFKTIYAPQQARASRKLPRPDKATWEALAAFYNSQRYQQLAPDETEIDDETIEKWLIACATAARSYLYPSVTSINKPQQGNSESELLDQLAANEGESLLTAAIAEEESQTRQTQTAQMSQTLETAIANLEPPLPEILQLYYSDTHTQQQIAAKLGMKQYAVSRRLSKARQLLLQKLANWSQENLHITLNSDVLKHTSTVLEDWLSAYYKPTESSRTE
ncbi:sigma-70 family RNA polymerase sigma factor [Oscillatoria salina]|uniref:sigma-70 family RNA polymerase sigma factor n=1 Tax=Oscillatoria salina TaxID=331517 RepID=UPI0013B71008|nr:sigma-70 family RNA polymerase sigma factor [Oscillatoria salina]MBZ8179663.1 sigma-70 family RNA polymerase sigma factor [Oscillatoria salina IIICB1]NET89260.1 sigma-70 family RNA polymerase sigma factor [Kamptonema sp. SIO1D9]